MALQLRETVWKTAQQLPRLQAPLDSKEPLTTTHRNPRQRPITQLMGGKLRNGDGATNGPDPLRKERVEAEERPTGARVRDGRARPTKDQNSLRPLPQPASSAIPPWPTQEETKVSNQAPIAPSQAATLAFNTELATAVRKHFGDITQAPDDIQKAMEKTDKATTKALSTDLNKASKQVGQAAKQVATVKDARSLHRQNSGSSTSETQ